MLIEINVISEVPIYFKNTKKKFKKKSAKKFLVKKFWLKKILV